MVWTHFHDMHSGGGQKLAWAHIYIEAPEAVAADYLVSRFGRSPYNVTCDCCGDDYSVSEELTLEAASWYERGLHSVKSPSGEWRPLEPGEVVPEGWSLQSRWPGQPGPQTVAEFENRADILIVRADEIARST